LIEAHFNIVRKMADAKFARATSWEEIIAIHRKWMRDYNVQRHWAHEKREDSCHSPIQVLAWHKGTMYSAEFLDRILFATRFTRRLDKNGYLRLQNWKLYGERGLAKAPFRSPQLALFDLRPGEWLLYWKTPELASARRRRRVAGIMQLPLFDPEPIDLAVEAAEGRDAPHPRSHLQLVEKPPSDQ
jgi:hypothetical protein